MKIEKGRIIGDIIEANKIQYSIPVYQRNYDWTDEQCKKLFVDVVNAGVSNKDHFVGSVVISVLQDDPKFHRYIIIDGQQRITTIVLLLKALYDNSSRESDKERIDDLLFNSDKYGELKIDQTNKLKLKPIKSDNDQLQLLISGKIDQIDKSSRIFLNYQLFDELIKNELQRLNVKEIINGLERLICGLVTLDNDDNPQEVFESINSTGLPLTISDLIRNFVLMTDENQESLYDDYWLPIENLIGKKDMPSFIVDYINFKIDGFATSKDAYDKFKMLFSKHNYTNETMLIELKRYAEYYNSFIYGNDKYGTVVKECLNSLKQLKQTTVFPFLFALFDDYNEGVCSLKDLEKVLTFIVNYSVRRIVCEVNSNSLRGLYKTLHSRIYGKTENKEHYFDAFASFFYSLTSRDKAPSDEEFILALKQNDLYHKNTVCKFVLGNVENRGSKEVLVLKNLTIEHIMPQNQNMRKEWKDMLGENWYEVHVKYLHTLGNLTLTGYNSELSDEPFKDKKDLLKDKKSKVVTLNEFVLSQDVWNEDAIIARARILADVISKMYYLEKPEIEISFADKSYKEYTLDNIEHATGKTPNYYIFRGEKVPVNDYSDMTNSIFTKLYEMDSSIIERIAKNNELIVEWSTKLFFSYDKTLFRTCSPLNDTGVYYNTYLNPAYKMAAIKALLGEYGIDIADFVYSAKSNKSKD